MNLAKNAVKFPPKLYLFLRQLLYGGGVGAASGLLSGVFLRLLTLSTDTKHRFPFLLFFLPAAGALCVELYRRFGKGTEAGNHLILERIHEAEGDPIPFRMAPLVLVTTLLTHICGGSAGREGTAVQMGGAVAEGWGRLLRVSPAERRLLLMAGMSGGFGSVFGTPLAGTVFGMEVLAVGRIEMGGLIACLAASVIGDVVCRSTGVRHFVYPTVSLPPLTLLLWGKIFLLGAASGGTAKAFLKVTHAVRDLLKRTVRPEWFRPVIGGAGIIALVYALNTRAYLGLGIELIGASFAPEGVPPGAFALKLLFTSVTLGSGFRGGEVTPLFCMGATLGNALALLAHAPVPLFAALGFASVFAGAAQTPIACLLLGMELFGGVVGVPLLVCCVLSVLVVGRDGLYPAQKR